MPEVALLGSVSEMGHKGQSTASFMDDSPKNLSSHVSNCGWAVYQSYIDIMIWILYRDMA